MANHDVFICFSSRDESTAFEVVSFLESHGLRCWISSRDVEPGHNYQESIVTALEIARAVVFLFSENSSRSNEIKKELSLAASDTKVVVPLRLTTVMPSGALRYELATRQWIDAFPDRARSFEKLLATLTAELQQAGAANRETVASVPSPAPASPAPNTIASAAPVRVGSEEYEAVRALLARHVGPIAKVLMQKAAGETRSADAFCERLAGYVQAPAERAAFLQAARARLAAGA
jgi:hypothetical protein